MYKVSLILTTYNSAENLPKTLASIDEQDYPDIEVVIKDGGSTDGTLDIIEEYAKKHADVTEDSQILDKTPGKVQMKRSVVTTSCRDTGIYDAMNQGYKLSTGDIIAFFNDRFMVKDAVSKLVSAITNADTEAKQVAEPNEKFIGVHADLVYANGDEIVRYWHMGPQRSIRTGWMPGHPTLFLKREVYEKYGLYDTSYKIAADYEFMVRFLKDRENRLAYVPETLISMYYGGTSNSTLGSYIESLIEGNRALRTNHVHPAFLTDCIRTLRVLLQFLKR